MVSSESGLLSHWPSSKRRIQTQDLGGALRPCIDEMTGMGTRLFKAD